MSEGDETYGPKSKHWIDGDEDAESVLTFEVPPVVQTTDKEEESKIKKVIQDELEEGAEGADGTGITCTTRYDDRASSIGFTTSPEGTSCVFGVDERDEGKHCIMDEGAYGSYGWCYTTTSGSSWGACDKNCPLWGHAKILGEKIDELRANAGLADEENVEEVDKAVANAPAAQDSKEASAKAPAAAPAAAKKGKKE